MEKHVFELVRGLLQRNIDVRIICEDKSHLPDPANELEERIIAVPPECLRTEGWAERYAEKSQRFAELLDPASYDVVHCHSHYGRDVALKLAQLDRRPALITTYHLTPLGQLERFRQLGIPEPAGAPIDRAVAEMEAMSARLSDRCIAVSRGVQQEVVRFYGVPEERVAVIYDWYDPSNFAVQARETARKQLSLSPDAPYLLYIGHFQHHRGELLAEAMRLLPPEITLLVVHPEADEAIAAEFGCRVRFFGYQPPDQLGLLYAVADLHCFPTVYSGFGLVLVEGMACGCPPIVFNYSAMNEIVTPAAGYLVETATAEAYAAGIVRALPTASEKCDAAVQRSRGFRMDRQIDRVVDLYCEPAR
jgi:glycosyltransferase involved in cell wall biosynthesis